MVIRQSLFSTAILFLSSIISFPIYGKICEKEFLFDSSTLNVDKATTSYEFVTGEAVWKMQSCKNLYSTPEYSITTREGFPDPLAIRLPSSTTQSGTRYITLITEMDWPGELLGVDLYAWTSNDVKCDVAIANAAGITYGSNGNIGSTTLVSSPASFPISFTAQGMPENEERYLKFYFSRSASTYADLFIGKIVVRYDDGESLSLKFSVDDEPQETGCRLNSGSILKVDCPEDDAAEITYRINDMQVEFSLQEGGIRLDTPGNFEYHFRVKAPGYEEEQIDFQVEVSENPLTSASQIHDSLFDEESVYYDFSGRKVKNPGRGVFVESAGEKSRIIIRR